MTLDPDLLAASMHWLRLHNEVCQAEGHELNILVSEGVPEAVACERCGRIWGVV